MRWNRANWTFLINAFEERFLDKIALGKVVKDDAWGSVKKG